MKTSRFLPFIIISLIVAAIPAVSRKSSVLEQLTGCITSSPSSGAYTATICFSNPSNESILMGNSSISATISVSGTSPGVQRIIFYLDAVYLLTDYEYPYTFTLPTNQWVDGNHILSVKALMRDAFTTEQANIMVSFLNGVTSAPVNNNQFQPFTEVASNGAPFIVAAAGDGAGGETNAGNITNLIASFNPNMLLYLGDVYEKGTATEFYNWYGTETTYFGRFRAITNPTIGNHEYTNHLAPGYFNYWDNIPNYYSYQAHGWHFVSLNANASILGVDPQSAQYQWLQQDLAALPPQTCKIVYYHQPLFNIGSEGSTTAMTDIWNLMAQYGVDIVLNGHDHTYQRWSPLNGNGQLDPNGIIEFVAGASGHGLGNFAISDSRVAYSINTKPDAFGVLLLQLNQRGANFSYRSTTGAVLDAGVIPCDPAMADSQAPTTPTQLSANASGPSQVSLSWAISSDDVGIAGYTILRDDLAVTNVPAHQLTYDDTGLSPGRTYRYKVQAFDQAGNTSAVTMPVSATTFPMPVSLTLQPEADTYVKSDNPTMNYGAATTLRADVSPDLHSYLRFNVQGLYGTPIAQVRLLLYAANNGSQGVSALTVSSNNWNEKTMNYTNQPALGSMLDSSGAYTSGQWVTLDVTAYVTGEGLYSFGLTTPGSTALSFPSREASANRPQLIIDFQNAAAALIETTGANPTLFRQLTVSNVNQIFSSPPW